MKKDLLEMKKILSCLAIAGTLGVCAITANNKQEVKTSNVYERIEDGKYKNPYIVTYRNDKQLFNVVDDMESEEKKLRIVNDDSIIERNLDDGNTSFIYVKEGEIYRQPFVVIHNDTNNKISEDYKILKKIK